MSGKTLVLAVSALLSVGLFASCQCGGDKLVKSPDYESVCQMTDGGDESCQKPNEVLTVEVDCSTACGPGKKVCSSDGACAPCTARQPGPVEIPCNDIDDDCDGTVDNAPIVFCYLGVGGLQSPDLAHYYSECRPGIEVMNCVTGKTTCKGWVGPQPEECDGLDNNCNGQIDEGLVSPGLDVVLVLDESCSMQDKIASLIDSTANTVDKYQSRANLRFSLVLAPGSDPAQDGFVTLKKNFTNVADFIAVLKTQTAGNTASEPTIDAVYDISAPLNPLGLTWAAGAKKTIIVYSDEEHQSHRNPRLTEQAAIDEAKNNNVTVYVFTSALYLQTWSQWNSRVFSSSLEQQLDDIISSNFCQKP